MTVGEMSLVKFKQILKERDNSHQYNLLFNKITGNEGMFIIHPSDFNKSVEFVINRYLPEKEKEIIKMRFGIGKDCRAMTQKEIGEILKITKTRVGQLEHLAIAKLSRNKAAINILEMGLEKYIKNINTGSIVDEEMQLYFKTFSSASYITIHDLGLNARITNVLTRNNINYFFELLSVPSIKLLEIREFGKKSLEEVETKIDEFLKINKLLDRETILRIMNCF